MSFQADIYRKDGKPRLNKLNTYERKSILTKDERIAKLCMQRSRSKRPMILIKIC